MFDLELHSDFDFQSKDFLDVFLRSDATPFQHPIWLDRLYARVVPRVGAEPAVVTLRSRQDGRLVAVLPLVRRRSSGIKIIEFADLAVSDYVAPICSRDVLPVLLSDRSIGRRILTVLQPYDLIRICKVRDEWALLTSALMPGSQAKSNARAYAVSLFSPFDSWRASMLEPGFVRFLDKKRRLLGKKGRLRLKTADDVISIETAFSAMQWFRRFRFKPDEDLLQRPEYFEFYRDVAVSGAQSGLCRTYVLYLGDRPVATMFGLAHRGAYLSLLMAFDFDKFRNYSVGLLLVEDMIADCIARGDILFDLTIGDEPYKRKLGTQFETVWTLWNGATLKGRLASVMFNSPAWARSAMKHVVGSRP